MARTRITVGLLVCDACGHVGPIPVGLFDGKGYCTGPRSAPHKRLRMEVRKFVEVPASRVDQPTTTKKGGRS